MAVEFQRGEFGSEFANQWRVDAPAIQALFEEMDDFNGTPRQARAILRRVNDATNQFGVETVSPERNAGDRELIYINTGDTYSGTVGYDVRLESFVLTTWGGWLEEAEREIHEAGEPARNDEEACTSCDLIWNVEQLEDEVCARCREKNELLPTWQPNAREPLVVLLRSIEGAVLAVHYIPPNPFNTPPHPTTLAFSMMQTEDHFIASPRVNRYGHHLPYTNTYENLVDVFTKKRQADVFVASDGSGDASSWSQNLGIEREMFHRLHVAMDAFFETGMTHQPEKAFLRAPPVLWTCDQVVGCVWYEERGESTVECYVHPNLEKREYGAAPGSDPNDLSIWGVRSPELDELVEDGFIQPRDDRSVRSYLHDIGRCRK